MSDDIDFATRVTYVSACNEISRLRRALHEKDCRILALQAELDRLTDDSYPNPGVPPEEEIRQ